MRIATVQTHDGQKLVVDVDGDHRRLEFGGDLLALIQSGVDLHDQVLALGTRVNGEVMQDSSTAQMLFGVAELLAFCSRTFTLEPGDLLLTGTPWGCGYFMNPPRALEVGDLVECEVERIGVLRNVVAAA